MNIDDHDKQSRSPRSRDQIDPHGDRTASRRTTGLNRRSFLGVAGLTPFLLSGPSVTGRLSRGGSGTQSVVTESPWTVAVLPDTQNYVRRSSRVPYAQAQTEWIVNNVDTENIVFVAFEGDLVHNADSLTEWQRFESLLDTLDGDLDETPDGLVPYATPPGNHDWVVWNDRTSSTANYRQYCGGNRYAGRSWFGGSAPNDLSHYQFFSAGGYTFLHIALEWEAPGTASDPDTQLGWAQGILDQYSDLPTIITTHSYLWDDEPKGRTTFVQEVNGDGNSGHTVFEEIIEPNPQVFMVLCGHFFRDDGPDEGEYHQVSENASGLPVYEMLANFQSYPNGGDGWMRLVQFVPGGGTSAPDRIEVQTYSPVYDAYQTEARSEFAFDLDFTERFDTTTEPTLSVQEAVASANPDGDDTVIDQLEIQLAINWWATDTPVPNTGGEVLTTAEVQQLVNLWATGATV